MTSGCGYFSGDPAKASSLMAGGGGGGGGGGGAPPPPEPSPPRLHIDLDARVAGSPGRSYFGTSGSLASASNRLIDRLGRLTLGLRALKVGADRCRRTGMATLRTSSRETLKRPSIAAMALPARMRF